MPSSLLGTIAAAASALVSASAAANTSNVFSPAVAAEDHSFEFRLSYLPSIDGQASRLRQRLHYQHGLSDGLRARLMVGYDESPTRGREQAFTRFEVQWQYNERRAERRLDAAVRFEIEEGAASPDRLRLAWSGNIDLSNGWQLRGNALVGRQFSAGRRPGLQIETRFQATYRVSGNLRIGLEMFDDFNTTADGGDFDAQMHQLGPVLKLGFGRWSLRASYLAGLSDAAEDANWRLMLGRGF